MKKINRIKVVLLAFFSLVLSFQAKAQQDPQYTQYLYNPAVINPAYSGSVNHLQFFGLYRTQWVGLEGAPETINLSATMPLGTNGLGLGIHFRNDNIGVTNDNSLSVDLAYTIDLNHEYKLAFGLKGSGSVLNVDYDQLHIYDPTDPMSANNISNKLSANVGAGLYLYSDKAYAGISAPMLLSSKLYNDNDYQVMTEKVHLYFMGGYVFDLDYNIQFKPAGLVKVVPGAPVQVDLTANFLFNNKLTLGAAYRVDASVSGLVGFQALNNLFIGYAYDADTSRLSHYTSGTHEVFLKFDLFGAKKSKVAPRFF